MGRPAAPERPPRRLWLRRGLAGARRQRLGPAGEILSLWIQMLSLRIKILSLGREVPSVSFEMLSLRSGMIERGGRE